MMFHAENKQNIQEKSKRSYAKKSHRVSKSIITRQIKPKVKSSKHQKHSKFKNIPSISEYVGQERLTSQIGIFKKGRISDSISRLEKIMPSDARARVQQDLQQVLKLSKHDKARKMQKCRKKHKTKSRERIAQSFTNTSSSYHKNSGFSNSSWRNKIQQSIEASAHNSILNSVRQQTQNISPMENEILIARETLLSKIHPFIKEVNSSMFPNISNKDKVKSKLLQIKNQLKPPEVVISSEQSSICSTASNSPQILSNKTKNSSYKANDVFELNPIFTQDLFDFQDITQFFPPINSFKEYCDVTSEDSVEYYDNLSLPLAATVENKTSSQAPSSSIGVTSSSKTFVPSSPTSSNSPSWKLNLSPVKFVPKPIPSPVYYRHKMF